VVKKRRRVCIIGIRSLPFSRHAFLGREYANSRHLHRSLQMVSAGRPQNTLTEDFLVHTLNHLRFVFDPAKDAINRSKLGVSLSEAARLDWSRVLAKLDTRTDYGEPRQIGYGPIGRRLYCIVFVDRGDTLRIISLRKANNREIDRYEAQIDASDRD